jgi:hypothetical protein
MNGLCRGQKLQKTLVAQALPVPREILNFCYMPNFRKRSEAEIHAETLSPALPKSARGVKVRRATIIAFSS